MTNGLRYIEFPPLTAERCRLKAQCTPSAESRLVFRSLVEWAESSVGIFHRCLSVVMFAAAICICVGRPVAMEWADRISVGRERIVRRPRS